MGSGPHLCLRPLICSVAVLLVSTFAVAAPYELSIVGTDDGMDVLRALGRAFMAENQSIQVYVPPSIESSGGISAVANDKAVLGRVARVLTDSEVRAGIQYKPIAKLPSAFYVNPDTRVTSLTSDQLADVYAGRVTNWKQVGGADLRIRVVRREEQDSTLKVLRMTMPRWKDLDITDRSKTAVTTEDAINTVHEVSGTIGFGPLTKTLKEKTVVLKIDGRYPTDDEYPSDVTLALIYKNSTITPAARSFLAFLGTEKASAILKEYGTVPINNSR
jgi:phosphate transport system substrate-binding protein